MIYVVQAVKEREAYVTEILRQVPEAIVYYDEFHDVQKAYLHICKDIIKGEPCVLMQDDIILTSDFKNKIESVISSYPDTLINFFSLSKKYLTPHWKKGREHCMAQCEYYPKGFSLDVVRVYEEWKSRYKETSAIDFLAGYAWGNNKPYLVWCPSLVQHRVAKSVIDPKRSSKRQSITFEE